MNNFFIDKGQKKMQLQQPQSQLPPSQQARQGANGFSQQNTQSKGIAHQRNFSGGPPVGSQQPQFDGQQVQAPVPKPKQSSQSKLKQQQLQQQSQSFQHAYTQQNVSFDNSIQSLQSQSFNQGGGRLKSYSQQQYNSNILDELNDYTDEYIPSYEEQINVTLGKETQVENQYMGTQSDQELKEELAAILGKTLNGQQSVTLQVDELSCVISLIESCMKESQYILSQKEQEKESSGKDQQIEQQKSQILALKNEVSEIKEVIHMRPSERGVATEDLSYKLCQLEQENEMLRLENKQAIRLAVQGRNKKGEKELGELITKLKSSQSNLQSSSGKQVNNYSILLNQQYNKIYQQERKNSNKGSNQKQNFNLF